MELVNNSINAPKQESTAGCRGKPYVPTRPTGKDNIRVLIRKIGDDEA
ncbi:hypothetical protein [Allocoleopsis sp.]